MPTFEEDAKLGTFVPLIKSADLSNASVTTDKIKDSSVTNAKLATGAVTSEKLQYNAVTTEIIDDNAVTTDKIYDGAVTSEKIAEGAITKDGINNKAVTNVKIDDAAVDTRTIEDKSVTNSKLADESITQEKIFNSSVTTEKLADESVSAEKLQSGLRSTIVSTHDKAIELDKKKANITDVDYALECLENKIGDRVVVEGNVTNLPDDEDLTSIQVGGREVMKLNNRAYEPNNFSGKGYKILRKNIQRLDLPTVTIIVSYTPSYSGDITITINGKATTVSLDVTTDTTTTIIATKIGTALKASLDDYDVSVSSSTIVLTRNNSQSAIPSSIDVGNTTAGISVKDSITKGERKNVLEQDMINDPNTVYEIRYSYDLINSTITIPDDCILKFTGGSLKGGKLKTNNVYIEGSPRLYVDVENLGNDNIYIDWFMENQDVDISTIINKIILYNDCIVLSNRMYNVKNTINITNERKQILGNSYFGTSIKVLAEVGFHIAPSARYINISNLVIIGNKANCAFDFSTKESGKSTHFITLQNLYIRNFDIGISSSYISELISPTLWNCKFEDLRVEHCNKCLSFTNKNNVGKHFGNVFKRVLLLSAKENLIDISENVNLNFESCNFGINNINDISIVGYDAYIKFQDCNLEEDTNNILNSTGNCTINITGAHVKFELCTFIHRDANLNQVLNIHNGNSLYISYCKYSGDKQKFWGPVIMGKPNSIILLNNIIPSFETYFTNDLNIYTLNLNNPLPKVNILNNTDFYRKINLMYDTTSESIVFIQDNGKVRYLESNVISPYKVGGTADRPKRFSSNIYGVGYRYYDYEKKIVSIANIDHYAIIQAYSYIDDVNYNSSANRPIKGSAITGQFFFDTTLKKPLWWNGSDWIDSNGVSADAKKQGTTAKRPTDIQIGYIYKDTTLNKLIIWNGTEWTNMDGTAL